MESGVLSFEKLFPLSLPEGNWKLAKTRFCRRSFNFCIFHYIKYARIRVFTDPYSPVYGRIRASENPYSRIFYATFVFDVSFIITFCLSWLTSFFLGISIFYFSLELLTVALIFSLKVV